MCFKMKNMEYVTLCYYFYRQNDVDYSNQVQISMDVLPWSALRLRRWPTWVQLKHKYKTFSVGTVYDHGTLVFGHKTNKF